MITYIWMATAYQY